MSELLTNPAKFCGLCWPQYRLYDKQLEIIESLRDNVETVAHAGNELGKDFISAMAVLWFFASRSPCYVVTTSSNERQLEVVLWGEMKRMIDESRCKFPFEVTHLRVRRYNKHGAIEPQSAIMGKEIGRAHV